MTSFSMELQDAGRRPADAAWIRSALCIVGVAIAITALADFLFYQRVPGISVAIFAATLCLAALFTNRIRARPAGCFAAFLILLASLAPAVEDFGLLSAVLAIAGACAFTLLVTGWPARPMAQRLADVAWMAVSGPFRISADVSAAVQEAKQRDVGRHGVNWLMAWIIPLGLGGVFLMLFAEANPVIEQWLESAPDVKHFDLARVLFWSAAAVLTWPFLRVRLTSKPAMQHIVEALELELSPSGAPPSQPAGGQLAAAQEPLEEPPMEEAAAAEEPRSEPAVPPQTEGPLFGRTAILRSLVLFNALFAVQSVLDITYLWGGLALPDGMTYAAYAHRGAYPLIVTALMAGGFVLAAMQPGTAIARSWTMRALVFLWIGQNVLLVMSSILRLDLYVEIYSLTEWRCAAFVWMLLVAAGLVLIVVRIVLDRTNAWLVWANAATLALALYLCSLIDFSGAIADFNVMHSKEVAGAGQPADVPYLCSLGPAALPAIDMLTKAKANVEGWEWLPKSMLLNCRLSLEGRFTARMADWRAWTFRSYRLNQYLDGVDARAPASGEPQAN